MPVWFFIVVGIPGALGALWLMWKGLRRAEETDRPLERLAIRVALSLGVLMSFGAVLYWMIGRAPSVGGGMVGGFAAAFVIAGSAAVIGILLGIIWAPEFGRLVARPFTNLFLGSDECPAPQPLYSPAIARRKQGKYAEAVTEVRAQLDRFPDDLQGWLLLAEIQMEDLRDFAQASATLEEFASRPGQSPQHIIFARARVADWHLKYRQDYESARALLEGIVAQFPGEPQARTAYQRLAHFEEMQQYAAARAAQSPVVPHTDPHLGLRPRQETSSAPVDDGTGELERLRQHLDQFPLDREAREKAAMILTYQQHRPDLGAEQMEYLLGLPDATPVELARWLNLLADLHIKEAHDGDAARQALERLIELLPGSPGASQAARRLDLLELEVRNAQEAKRVTMGTYEQRVGLKMSRRRKWWNEPD